ncbi:hypothetical protein SOPP22_18335 [Shewanella sp. OPT22]|nr:hypothetical protein SOPP22_18335 [Shewanella sp. OPT22]
MERNTGNLKTFHATFINDGKDETTQNVIHGSITGIMNGDVEYRVSEHKEYLQMMHVQLKHRLNRLKDVVEATIPTAIEEKALTKEEKESLLAAADEDSTGQPPSSEKVSQENKVKLDAKRAELESIKGSFETVCSALGNIDKSEGVEAYNGVILTFNELVSRIDRLNEPLDWDSEQYLSEAKGATNLRHTFETQIVEFLDTQIGLRKNGEMPLKRNKRLEKLNVLRENAAPKYKTPAIWTTVTRK